MFRRRSWSPLTVYQKQESFCLRWYSRVTSSRQIRLKGKRPTGIIEKKCRAQMRVCPPPVIYCQLRVQTTSDDISPPAQSSIALSVSFLTNQHINKKRKNRKAKSGVYDYVPSANTLGTLDVIISVVGDFFGQRDLLSERKYYSLGGTWQEA